MLHDYSPQLVTPPLWPWRHGHFGTNWLPISWHKLLLRDGGQLTLTMTIFNIPLDLEAASQPRNEPRYSRPRPSPSRLVAREAVCAPSASERQVLDVELRITSRQPPPPPPAAPPPAASVQDGEDDEGGEVGGLDLGPAHTQTQVVLEAQAGDTVAKLSKPVWPKSSPTIPSSLFKNDFQTKVKQFCHSTGQESCHTIFSVDVYNKGLRTYGCNT